MISKQREKTAYDHIRAQLMERVERSDVPEDVRVFVTDDWARLMTEIFLNKGNRHADWETGWETLNVLLWSLSPMQGRDETLHMLRLLPTLLPRLHEVCAALGYDLARRDRLFSTLVMLHAAVARAGLQTRAAGQESAGQTSPDADRTASTADKEPSNSVVSTALLALKVGDWLEFSQPEGDKRLRLEWISPQQGMYLFANEQGLDTLSLTRLRLAGRLNAGEIRPLD